MLKKDYQQLILSMSKAQIRIRKIAKIVDDKTRSGQQHCITHEFSYSNY
jgi:hypothetical protein